MDICDWYNVYSAESMFVRWVPAAIFAFTFMKTLLTCAVTANRTLMALIYTSESNLPQSYAVCLFLKILVIGVSRSLSFLLLPPAKGYYFDPPARAIFFPRIDDSHCHWVHSPLTVIHYFDDGYVGMHPLA